jgi:two-component system chemotaxis response regulator CheY
LRAGVTKLVVIVEDAETLAASLAVALETIPTVKVVIAHHPKIALRAFTPAGPHVSAIVTDLNLPELNGLELIRMIRELNGYRDIPAILITAEECAVPVNGNIMGSPNAIFRKPFSIREVCRVVESLLH